MTRRDRHLRIIENMGDRHLRYHLDLLFIRHGLSPLTDDAVEKLARSIMTSHYRQQKFNAEARARRSKQ